MFRAFALLSKFGFNGFVLLAVHIDVILQEEQKRNRALLDEVHRCNEEALHMKDELSRIKSDKTTRKDEQASSNNSKILTHFSVRDSKSKRKTSVPHAANSAQAASAARPPRR